MNNKVLIIVAITAALAGMVLARILSAPETSPTQAPAPQAAIGKASPQALAPITGPAPEFSLPDLQDKPHNITDWRGKTVLLNFWATWCPPCREEVPLFVDTQEKYKNRGFTIIGIAIDRKKDVENFVDSYFINYPVLHTQEKANALMARYGNRVAALPYSVLIGPDGNLIARRTGAFHKAELLGLLDKHLPKK